MPFSISKESADLLLKELASEFRKRSRKNHDVEMVIVGGGSILLNYGFRTLTDDFDFTSTADEAIKSASITVRDKYDLEYNWVNSDFTKTDSFSNKLREYSKPYKTYNNGHFAIRTITAEYLIAMKLVASREYKNDRSDIIGVLMSEKESGNNITTSDISRAYRELYSKELPEREGLCVELSKWTKMSVNELKKEYASTIINENEIGNEVRKIAKNNPNKMDLANIKEITQLVKEKLEVEQSKEQITQQDIEEMEAIRKEYFSQPKEERGKISWNGEQMRIAVFEDIYLSKCEMANVQPNKKIETHFWQNCVDIHGYSPVYVSDKRERNH